MAPNVRFNAIQAAILKPQLKVLDDLIEQKRERAEVLDNIFSSYKDHIQIQKKLIGAYSSYYSYPLYMNDTHSRNLLLEKLKDDYELICAYGYANPTPLYQCVNALINPKKYGKGFAYQERTYPAGTSPNAEDLLSRSFLIPFNENYSISETREIGERVINAIDELFS